MFLLLTVFWCDGTFLHDTSPLDIYPHTYLPALYAYWTLTHVTLPCLYIILAKMTLPCIASLII